MYSIYGAVEAYIVDFFEGGGGVELRKSDNGLE